MLQNDIPFNYSELRLHSVMIPALDRISDAVFAEQPVSKNGRSGRYPRFIRPCRYQHHQKMYTHIEMEPLRKAMDKLTEYMEIES